MQAQPGRSAEAARPLVPAQHSSSRGKSAVLTDRPRPREGRRLRPAPRGAALRLGSGKPLEIQSIP